MVLLPYLISYVIVAYIVNVFLSDTGIFNTILGVLGKDPVSWYMEKKYWPFILTFVNSLEKSWVSQRLFICQQLLDLAGIIMKLQSLMVQESGNRLQNLQYLC